MKYVIAGMLVGLALCAGATMQPVTKSGLQAQPTFIPAPTFVPAADPPQGTEVRVVYRAASWRDHWTTAIDSPPPAPYSVTIVGYWVYGSGDYVALASTRGVRDDQPAYVSVTILPRAVITGIVPLRP